MTVETAQAMRYDHEGDLRPVWVARLVVGGAVLRVAYGETQADAVALVLDGVTS